MKKIPKINGFDQERIVKMTKTTTEGGKKKTIRLDAVDTYILRWVVNLFNSSNSKKKIIDGDEYVWVKHGYLAENFPAFRLNAETARKRLKKLVELGLLTDKLVKVGGTYAYYGIGENYNMLASEKGKDGTENNTDGINDDAGRVRAYYKDGAMQKHRDKDNIMINNIKKDSCKDMSVSDIRETTHDGTLPLNDSFKKFIDDFGIQADVDTDLSYIDFDGIYQAYVESANFLQQHPQSKFLSWICKNYKKIIGGYYKDKVVQKPQSASEIWRKIYEREKAKEEAAEAESRGDYGRFE